MNIRDQQYFYGMAIGAVTFLAGVGLTSFVVPESTFQDIPAWKGWVWIYISAHFVTISGLQIGGLTAAFTEVDLIANFPTLKSLRLVPPLLTTIGGLVMLEILPFTRRFIYILKNSGSLLVGYLSAGLILLVASGAQPGLSLIILVLILGLLSLYIGSIIADRFTAGLPVFAFSSLSGIAFIGLLVVLGGIAVLDTIWPMIAVSALGVSIAGVIANMARN